MAEGKSRIRGKWSAGRPYRPVFYGSDNLFSAQVVRDAVMSDQVRFVYDGNNAAIGTTALTVFMVAGEQASTTVPFNVGEDHDRFFLVMVKGDSNENDSNHSDSGADRPKRFGAASDAGSAVGNQTNRPAAARSQRARTRGCPGARRFRPWICLPEAYASWRRDHLRARRLAGVSGRGQAADESQGR